MNISYPWIDRDAATGRLGVKPATLYAYVSRDLIRSVADPDDPRRSLYSKLDIDRFIDRRNRPRGRAEIAAGAISWGEPVLESGISTVRDGRLIFRDQDACTLAETCSLEDIAAHHWRAETLPSTKLSDLIDADTPRARAFLYLSKIAGAAPPSLGRARAALVPEAAILLSGFANALLGQRLDGPIHTRIGRAWSLSDRHTDLIRRALVLISDHELNASTFAVRVATSTGASLAASSLAGLAALSGPLHGNATLEAAEFLHAAIAAPTSEAVIEDTLSKGRLVPGIGHPLYLDGDTRGRALLAALKPQAKVMAVLAACERMIGKRPNVDLALAALSLELGLARHVSFSIFAIGRMSGWLAHAMEQAESGQLIRPRAVFRTPE